MNKTIKDFKNELKRLLKSPRFDPDDPRWSRYPARKLINPLISFLCSTDDELRWRAIVVMGRVVARLANHDMESARVIMRRLIWQLNDESGGIGWGVPEALGEITATHPRLAEEYGDLLISYLCDEGNFLEHPPLQRGVLWAIGRLAQGDRRRAVTAVSCLQPFFRQPDPVLRGLALWVLWQLRVTPDYDDWIRAADDSQPLPIFEKDRLHLCRPSELIKRIVQGRESS